MSVCASKLDLSEKEPAGIQVHLGSKGSNRYVHVFQVLFALFILALFGLPKSATGWLGAVLVLVFELYLSTTVYCIADEGGLHYQRWSHWNRVAWRDLDVPKRQPFAFYKCVAIRQNPLWQRYLLLPLGPSLHTIKIECEEDRAVRDLLQDGITGRTN